MTRLVVVVEDEEAIRESLVEVLQDEGYEARGFANGKEAFDWLSGSAAMPALILLDLRMPVMDGIAFREAQLAVPRMAAVPTIVISANSKLEERVASLEVAATLRKPVDLEELLGLVSQHAG